MTPISHANSTSNWLAITTKFWVTVMRTMPRMAAKVTTVIAMMRQGRFAMKLSFLFWNIPCFISWVSTMRMAKRLRKTEMRP